MIAAGFEPGRGADILHRLRHFTRELIAYAGTRRLTLMMALMLVAAVMEGISLALLVPLLAVLTAGAGEGGVTHAIADSLFGLIGAATPLARLSAVVALFAFAMIVRAFVLKLRETQLALFQLDYVADRRLKLLQTVAAAPWSRVAALRHARVTNAITAEISRTASAAYAVLRIIVAAVTLAIQFLLTFLVSWPIALIALALTVVAAAIFATRLKFANLYGAKLSKRSLELVNTTGQLLGGLKQAAAENGQQAFVRDFAETGRQLVAEQYSQHRRVARFHFSVAAFSALAGCLVLIVGAWLEGDVVALLAALLILTRMTNQAVGMQRDVEVLVAALPAHGMILELEAELADTGSSTGNEGPPPSGTIAFDHVTYLHAETAGLRDLSLAIAPGEIIGIVGASGAGKTTFIDLVAGLLAPQSGSVRVGETVLDPAAAQAWRGRIAYVAQDSFLTNTTIRRNLAGADEGADEDAMWRALELVAVADTVRAMPAGLDTSLAERGSRLSGGERQRIALARAIMRRPSLLILDEATNAIDVATEERILGNLAKLDPEMTILLVAHRRETLRHCTRILTIEGGRLVADEAV